MSSKNHSSVYRILIVLTVVVIVILGLLFFLFKKPSVSNFGVNIGSYPSNDTLAIKIKLKLYNPNFIGLPVDSVQYKVMIDEELNGFGGIHHNLQLKANSYETIELPLKYFFSPKVKEAIKNDIDYGLFAFHFRVYTHIGKFVLPFNYTISDSLPLFKTLYFNIDSIGIKHLGLKKSNVIAFITLTNPNQLKFRSTRISYKFYVDGKDFAKGVNTMDVLLKAKGKLALQLPIEIKSGDFVKDMILFKKHNQNKTYRIVCHLDLKTDSKPPETIMLRVERQGLLKEIHDGMKKGTKGVKIRF